ncbi:MAG TPA: aldolase/citrate lyase family protein [Chloroflexota bacterium]|nr:aldolase/citrate lyase family protein [Chloroflexota bacterium]
MLTNSLKHKLAAGQPATVIAPFASSAGLVELLGHLGFDGVFLDCEHGPGGWEDIEHMVRAAEVAGYSSVVRVDRNDAATITRALDRGAGGVQIPHVNTATEAAAAVQHAKYAPLGHRGWSGWRAVFGEDPAEYPRRANAETLVVVMLEEVDALHNLDEILRIEHIDVFFVAPGDLAQSMGFPGQVDHPQLNAAIEDALRRVRAAGRVSGTLTTPALVDRHLELGVQFLYVGLGSLLGPAARDFVHRVHGA